MCLDLLDRLWDECEIKMLSSVLGFGCGCGCGCGVPLIRSITVRGYSLHSIFHAHGSVPKRTKETTLKCRPRGRDRSSESKRSTPSDFANVPIDLSPIPRVC